MAQNVIQKDIVDIQKDNMLQYMMSLMYDRAIPDIRDGLKPVQKFILWSCYSSGFFPNKPHVKCAKIAGDVIANFHPHSLDAAYEALCRLAQTHSMNIPLIDFHGACGSIDGSGAAAHRYCVTGDTLISLPNGKLKRIDELIENSNDDSTMDVDFEVLDFKNNPVHVSKFFNSGKHDIIKIKTSSGCTIRGSYNHPILCLYKNPTDGLPEFRWTTLDKIETGCYAVIASKFNNSFNETISEEEKLKAIFFGGMVSEGGLSKNQRYYRVSFSNQDNEYYNLVESGYKVYLEENNLSNLNIRINPNARGGVKEFCTEDKNLHNLVKEQIGEDAHNKQIPPYVLNSNLEIQRWFLKALFEGDGGVTCRLDKRRKDNVTGHVFYSTSSTKLLNELKILLMNFGIRTKVTKDRSNFKLTIYSLTDMKIFKEKIGFLSDRKNKVLNELVENKEIQITKSYGVSSSDKIPYLAEFIRNNKLRNTHYLKSHSLNCKQDIDKHNDVIKDSLSYEEYFKLMRKLEVLDLYHYEEIIEVERLPEEVVYSIKVDSNDHSFISNGFISHNTEAKLSKYGLDILSEIDKDAVDFEKNYDVTKDQPTVLPAVIPNILLNSSMGIAGGYASSIPPHNIKDVCNTVCELIDNPNMSVQDVAKKLVPDFPTGGILCSKKEIEKAYITGQGSVKLRGRATINRNKNNTSEIVITEIPFMTTIGPRMSGTSTNTEGGLINSIVAKIKDGTIDGIKDIHDISDKNGLCIKVFIKKDYDPDVILNQLYKFTQLESTFKIILVCKNGNFFKVYNIKEILTEWIEFRVSTIRRIITHDIKKAKYREHILEGLLKALTDIDTVISIIKKANGRADAKVKLVRKYGFTDLQVEAILDMKLSQLNSLDGKKLEEEKLSKQKEILELKENWKESNIYERIKKEQKEFAKKYGSERKTTVEEIDTDITTEDIIADEDTLIVITQGNYIKRISNEFRTQKRGTQGISIGDNSITEMFSASTKDHLLCFTNTARVYDLKAYDIKESKDLKAKGLRIENYLNLKENETVTNILCINNTQMNDNESFLVFATKNGMIKKTKLEEFNNIRSTGIIALMLKSGDELVSVKYIDTSKPMQDILISTKNAQTVRYDHEEIKELGRNTYGVIGINLENDDRITDMCIIEDDEQLIFFATKNGLGKTIRITDNVEKVDPNTKEKVIINDGFPRLKRSSNIKGRLCMKLKENDELVSMVAINNVNDELMIVTDSKLLVVNTEEFKEPLKRPTYGKKLVSLTNEDYVRKVILK